MTCLESQVIDSLVVVTQKFSLSQTDHKTRTFCNMATNIIKQSEKQKVQ